MADSFANRGTFSELATLPGTEKWGIKFEEISKGAVKWLLDSRASDGVIPYVISPPYKDHLVYQPITYSSESFVSNALRFPESAVPMAGRLNVTVDYMINEQNADGTWGKLLSGDGERSPRVVSLLQWHSTIFPSAKSTAGAIYD